MSMESLALANTADHPALSLLNTTMHPRGGPVELLETGGDLLTWLASVGLVDDSERRSLARRFPTAELDEVAAGARDLREQLRPVIVRWAEQGGRGPLPSGIRTRLNRLLAADPPYVELGPLGADDVPELRTRRHRDRVDQLLTPIAESIADLLAHGEAELVRRCDGPRCTLWFYDRTKSHRRRWCSMAVCGNRHKAQTFRGRSTQDA